MAQVSFDITRPQEKYTKTQWQQKEQWYIQETNSINIPMQPTPAQVQEIASKIDYVLAIARIDYAYAKTSLDTHNMKRKYEEMQQFAIIKNNPPQQYVNQKLTVDEIKGIVASILLTKQWGGTSLTLIEIIEFAISKTNFMAGIISNLEDKKDLLITLSGMLKIESSLNNMTANTAPRNNNRSNYTQINMPPQPTFEDLGDQ